MVGDLLDDTSDGGEEMFRVVKTNGTIDHRDPGLRNPLPVTLIGADARQSSLVAHTAPWNLREYCSATAGNNGGQGWFNLVSDPTAQNGIVDYPAYITSHADYWVTGVWAEPNRYRVYSSAGAMIGAPE